MNSVITEEPKINLEQISQLLVDKICATTFDIKSSAQLIKLCCNCLESIDNSKICISTRHKLCRAIATCYFLLLETDNDNFPQVLSYIRMSLTCMSLLKQSTIASHILCRALLDRSLVYGHLFNANFDRDLLGEATETRDWMRDDPIKLSRENLKVSLGHRFRRLPNNCMDRSISDRKAPISSTSDGSNNDDKPDRFAINTYLLVEAFKSSINNIEAFAQLFVEFTCPVMFDKNSWPSDDSLKIINGRNLSILRKFEQVPPFWDLFELIGDSKCLGSCLVLVKALLAAHLALWASATTESHTDKMISTSRLIPPLSRSGLVPKAFGLAVEVFHKFTPGQVFCVLTDIWHYLKFINSNSNEEDDLLVEERKSREKRFLWRLRLFMSEHNPGPTYVRIFKGYYVPEPKRIPIDVD